MNSPLNDKARAAVAAVHELADAVSDRRLEAALGLVVAVSNDLHEQAEELDKLANARAMGIAPDEAQRIMRARVYPVGQEPGEHAGYTVGLDR